jgi:hypothetical protein
VQCADRLTSPGCPDTDTTCNQPLDPVTTVEPGSFYIARLPCLDCPVLPERDAAGVKAQHLVRAENELVTLHFFARLFAVTNYAHKLFTIVLSDDRTAVRINNEILFPSLLGSYFYAEQIYPNFTRAYLDSIVDCNQNYQRNDCVIPFYSVVALDYDIGAIENEVDTQQGTVQWEITLDAIGGEHGTRDNPTLIFGRPEQKMLKVVLTGKETEQDNILPDLQAASTLFGPFGEEQETPYEYEITDVQLVARSYKFPARSHTVWSTIKHFFGFDPVTPNHFVYLHEEWGSWAKKGTLKNAISIVIYDWPWDLIAIIICSVAGGLLVLYGMYRLIFFGIEQKRLAQWGGMDEAWRQIRRDGEEEGRLLDSEYRDEPDDTLPPRYTDDSPATSKPLPSKPLPEKPLPALPLIDDI